MDPIEELLDYAAFHGVMLNGITPTRIPARGIGIVATRDIEEDEVILDIPKPAIRSLNTVPRSLLRKLNADPGIITSSTNELLSVHGILAADLALDKMTKYRPWSAVCPTPEDLVTMPLLWPEELQELLPARARTLLTKQIAKSTREWELVAPIATAARVDRDAYIYAWLLVNTRTFYYEDDIMRQRYRGVVARDDCMALLPVADLFNHDYDDEESCRAALGSTGFQFRTQRSYKRGEELQINYGRHSGDFLLVEYGFVMEENCWDEVCLDEVFMDRLNDEEKERLEDHGFLGTYVLDSDGVCYRTEVALRLLCCPKREWFRFVNKSQERQGTKERVDALLLELLMEFRERAGSKMLQIRHLEVPPIQSAILVARWEQIQGLVDAKITSLTNELE